MDQKTLDTLEFGTVLDRLARHTASTGGRELALRLRPTTDHAEVVRRQRTLAEAVYLRDHGIEVPLGGLRDVRDAARRARRGAVLSPGELIEVATTAAATNTCRRLFTRVAADVPLLGTLGGGLPDLAALRTLITDAITDRGEVADGASPELRSIRREMSQAHHRLQQRMDQMIHSSQYESALQDRLVTIRDGRYVLPVRSESRGAVPGVVHDTSASGATVYIEPLAVVELGNKWRELQVQERREIERILRELSDAVGAAADELLDAASRLAMIDLAVASARLAHDLGAVELTRTRHAARWVTTAPAPLVLVEARHPLLGDAAADVVPISLEVGTRPPDEADAPATGDQAETGHTALLITGPNTGGKTVALKTAGLLTLMALAGLPVPAATGTTIPVYDAIFADIGDEQSIEQSLSTFSGHVTAIIDILERADRRSLVLLDELGAGTDPAEGAALAVAIVEELVARPVPVIATTHHSELKLYAHRTPGVMNASVEFDMETLSPTYRLRLGLPGRSNALAIATRLGMPAPIVARAEAGISAEEHELETMLGDLRAQLAAADHSAAAAEQAQAEAEQARAELRSRLAAFAVEQETLAAEAHERVQAEVRDATRLVERTRRSVEQARMAQADADLEAARQAARDLVPPPPVEPPPPEPGADSDPTPRIEIGRRVWLRGIASPGEVLGLPGPGGEFDVQLGALRTRARARQVVRTAAADAEPRHIAITKGSGPAATAGAASGAGTEIDVRGRTVDETLPELDTFLDHAARAGHPHVQIIHGKGTGALRGAVRDLLAQHPLVASHRSAERTAGGDGVTVAALVNIG